MLRTAFEELSVSCGKLRLMDLSTALLWVGGLKASADFASATAGTRMAGGATGAADLAAVGAAGFAGGGTFGAGVTSVFSDFNARFLVSDPELENVMRSGRDSGSGAAT